MKSKIAVETLRAQLKSSLDVFSKYSSTEDVKVTYSFDETENLSFTLPAEFVEVGEGNQVMIKPKRDVKAYGLVLEMSTLVDGETNSKRLWLRRYPIEGSLNEVRYQAFKELYDVMIGNFIVNATRTDKKTLEELSNKKLEEVQQD